MNKEQEKSKKVYPSISRIDNQYTKEPMFPLDKYIVIQEKLDGSNVSMLFWIDGHGLNYNLHSRTTNLTEKPNKQFAPFVKWFEENFDLSQMFTFMTTFGYTKVSLHGEWLMQNTLPYNQTHKNTFHLFDMKLDEKFAPYIAVREAAKLFKLNLVPILGQAGSLQFVLPTLIEKYVEGQTTNLNYDGIDAPRSPREGIVVKTEDGQFRLKFVSKEFKEGIKKQKGDKIPLLMVTQNLYPEEMISRFIKKLKENGTIEKDANLGMSENMRKIFPNAKILLDMFMEERFPKIEDQLKRLIDGLGYKALADRLELYAKPDEVVTNIILTGKFFTEARINKFLVRMVEDGKNIDDPELLEEYHDLVQDFMDEEYPLLFKLLNNVVKKQLGTAIRNYIEDQGVKKFIKTEKSMEDLNE